MDQGIAIGLFQLQNLLNQSVGFLFLHLGPSEGGLPESLAKYISQAQEAQDEAQAMVLIEAQGADPGMPIVLICQTGKDSAQLAGRLTAKNFINVCWVENGVSGLVEELGSE